MTIIPLEQAKFQGIFVSVRNGHNQTKIFILKAKPEFFESSYYTSITSLYLF